MKIIQKHILTFMLTIIAVYSFGQVLKTIKPTIGKANNYSKQEQIIWQTSIEKYSKINSGDLDYNKLKPEHKVLIDNLEMGFGPITEGPGCSWYCGGQMYKTTSTSYLKEQGNITYNPENIHDFNLFTAWIPDTTNGVTGKKINFHFKPLSPRVNEIKIYNGYIKNIDLFKANSRVKKFKLYIDNAYYATLELADTTAQQSFKIQPIQSKDKKNDLILTFEIVEVYRGDKYFDVAVSEINFGGIDVH
jgi:hypothetical protein